MPEDKKRMVPESDLLAVKAKLRDTERKLQDTNTQHSQTLAQLNNELKIAKANGDSSEEVELVRKHLLDQADGIKTDRAKYDTDLAGLTDREKKVRAKELATDLKSKGLEVDIQSLIDAEDMERHSKDLLVEFQGKEIERLKTEPRSAESVYERGAGGVLKKMPKEMTDAEFTQYEKSLVTASNNKK